MRIIFAGTPEFAVPTLRMLLASGHELCAVYTQPDRPSGRGRKLTASPVKLLAQAAGIPVLQPESLKAPEAIAELRSFAPDLLVVVAFGMILSQEVLDIPKLGCINVHGSLLPRWRGAAPIHRAIMAGDRETGVTIMRMVRQLDAGNMLHKEYQAIGAEDTSSEVHDKLAELGAIGLAKVLEQIQTDSLQEQVQDESLVIYAEKLHKQEANIDWAQPASQIARQVRALNAWPVAQTLLHGEVLRIWRAKVIPGEVTLAPGVIRMDAQGVVVATAQDWLCLEEVQLPGGKRMPMHAFMQAHVLAGVCLGA